MEKMNTSQLREDKSYSLRVMNNLRKRMTTREDFTFDTAYVVVSECMLFMIYCHPAYKDTASGLYFESIRRAELCEYPITNSQYEIERFF